MVRTPKDLADQMAARRRQVKADDGYARVAFTQLGEQARRAAGRWHAPPYKVNRLIYRPIVATRPGLPAAPQERIHH